MTSRLPQFYPAAWKEEFGLAGPVFAPGVCLGLVERQDGAYSFLTSDHLARLDRNFDELLSLGISTLGALTQGVELHVAKPPGATVAWVTAEDNFASVRILLPQVMSKLQSALGKGFLFSIPSRDLCLFWNIGAPRALTQKHAQEASDDFDSEEYNLTPHVLVFSNDWPCAVYDAAG